MPHCLHCSHSFCTFAHGFSSSFHLPHVIRRLSVHFFGVQTQYTRTRWRGSPASSTATASGVDPTYRSPSPLPSVIFRLGRRSGAFCGSKVHCSATARRRLYELCLAGGRLAGWCRSEHQPASSSVRRCLAVGDSTNRRAVVPATAPPNVDDPPSLVGFDGPLPGTRLHPFWRLFGVLFWL